MRKLIIFFRSWKSDVNGTTLNGNQKVIASVGASYSQAEFFLKKGEKKDK